MGLEVRRLRDAVQPARLIADRRLYLTADRATVVEEGDLRQAFLFAGEGCEIPPADVQRFGLEMVDGHIVARPTGDPEISARHRPADKARRKGEDK